MVGRTTRNGNRLTQTGTTAITFSVSSTNNQLTATSGGLVRTYGYDAAGNTQSNGAYSFAYNNRGRMASTNGASTLYLYNALGQMIEKSGTLGTTILIQDEAGHLIGEYSQHRRSRRGDRVAGRHAGRDVAAEWLRRSEYLLRALGSPKHAAESLASE